MKTVVITGSSRGLCFEDDRSRSTELTYCDSKSHSRYIFDYGVLPFIKDYFFMIFNLSSVLS